MTELRKRMIECLQLMSPSERTQESYVRAVRQLSEHYHKSPDLLTEAELRQYFLYLMKVKRYSRNTSTIAICGIKFFYERTLNRDWATFGLLRAPRDKKLSVILSLEEVRPLATESSAHTCSRHLRRSRSVNSPSPFTTTRDSLVSSTPSTRLV